MSPCARRRQSRARLDREAEVDGIPGVEWKVLRQGDRCDEQACEPPPSACDPSAAPRRTPCRRHERPRPRPRPRPARDRTPPRRAAVDPAAARSSESPAALGPAASSAIVTAQTATCTGSCSGCRGSRSMTTEVSSKPTGLRSDGRIRTLIDDGIKMRGSGSDAGAPYRGGGEVRHQEDRLRCRLVTPAGRSGEGLHLDVSAARFVGASGHRFMS